VCFTIAARTVGVDGTFATDESTGAAHQQAQRRVEVEQVVVRERLAPSCSGSSASRAR